MLIELWPGDWAEWDNVDSIACDDGWFPWSLTTVTVYLRDGCTYTTKVHRCRAVSVAAKIADKVNERAAKRAKGEPY